MDPSFPQASFLSSRVLWGYISLTHWHSWAGKSFSSRSSWDDWCKYAAAESRHWHHHHTDPVRERERGREKEGDVPSHLWLTLIFVTPHVSKTMKALSHAWQLCDVGRKTRHISGCVCTEWLYIFLDMQERTRAALDPLWCILCAASGTIWLFPAQYFYRWLIL